LPAIETTRGTLDGIGGRIETATNGFEGAIDAMRRGAEFLAARVEGNADRTGSALDKQLEATNETLKAISRTIAEALDGVTDRLRTTSQDAGRPVLGAAQRSDRSVERGRRR
jgi:methyl-accepting chemotaxis protein